MFSKIMGFVVAVCVGILFSACDGEPPVEIEKGVNSNMFLRNYTYIEIRAISDSVTIKDILLNRGNCKFRIVGLGGVIDGTYKEIEGKEIAHASTIAFGESVRKVVACPVDSLKEVKIVTDKGTWTFNF